MAFRLFFHDTAVLKRFPSIKAVRVVHHFIAMPLSDSFQKIAGHRPGKLFASLTGRNTPCRHRFSKLVERYRAFTITADNRRCRLQNTPKTGYNGWELHTYSCPPHRNFLRYRAAPAAAESLHTSSKNSRVYRIHTFHSEDPVPALRFWAKYSAHLTVFFEIQTESGHSYATAGYKPLHIVNKHIEFLRFE